MLFRSVAIGVGLELGLLDLEVGIVGVALGLPLIEDGLEVFPIPSCSLIYSWTPFWLWHTEGTPYDVYLPPSCMLT